MSYKRTFGDQADMTFAAADASYARAKQAVDSNMSNLLDFLRNTPTADLAANAFTGQMTAAQAERITDAATRDVMRAKPGISYSEARRMVEGDIKASIALNGGTAEDWLRDKFELGHKLATATEHTLLWAGVLVVAGIGAVLLAERRR